MSPNYIPHLVLACPQALSYRACKDAFKLLLTHPSHCTATQDLSSVILIASLLMGGSEEPILASVFPGRGDLMRTTNSMSLCILETITSMSNHLRSKTLKFYIKLPTGHLHLGWGRVNRHVLMNPNLKLLVFSPNLFFGSLHHPIDDNSILTVIWGKNLGGRGIDLFF